ncbi:hypothetical protein PoB_003020100 [Plakobranchus ocellatus]|uniref:Uncharacterized protein n=1 Tax=Plakobranchus ocellatus TaxID=259542 RepID=A0AAV4A608_9GAST|nr:hypothetical protein PoB_003020100 [Plakobranchus ocellatus]
MSRMMRGGETRRGEGRGRERWRKRNNNARGDVKGRKSGQEMSREGEERVRKEERAGRKSAEGFGGELGDFQLVPPQGKIKVLDRPVAIELARTGYIFRDKSKTTTSLPQASASIGQAESARLASGHRTGENRPITPRAEIVCMELHKEMLVRLNHCSTFSLRYTDIKDDRCSGDINYIFHKTFKLNHINTRSILQKNKLYLVLWDKGQSVSYHMTSDFEYLPTSFVGRMLIATR